jgi:hypothetical protein
MGGSGVEQTPTGGRIGAWLRRYGPAELLAIAATLIGGWTTLVVTDNILLAAIAGTWAENLAYYGTIIRRDLRSQERLSAPILLRTLRDLTLEFGPAELLDSLLIRPAMLAAAFTLIPAPALAGLLGKLAADVLFYLPTLTSYELLRRRRTAGSATNPDAAHASTAEQPRRT